MILLGIIFNLLIANFIDFTSLAPSKAPHNSSLGIDLFFKGATLDFDANSETFTFPDFATHLT